MSSTSGIGGSSSSMIRLTGMASGLDVDSIVKQMMTAEKAKYNKLVQKKEKTQWTEDAYREQTTLLTGFKSGYFDVLNSSSNMRSPNIYKQFTTTSSSTSVATVSSNSSATAGNHMLVVNQLATTSKLESKDSVSVTSGDNLVNSFSAISLSAISDSNKVIIDSSNDSLTLSLNGTQKTIKINQDSYKDKDSLAAAIQASVDSSFGIGSINVSINSSNIISFNPQDGTKTVNITSENVTLGIASHPTIDVSGGKNTFKIYYDGATTPADVSILVPASGNYDLTDSSQKAAFISNLQGAIDASIGANKVNAVLTSDNKLVFSPVDSSKSLKIADGSLTVEKLGFKGRANVELNKGISASSTLQSLGLSGTVSFKINGKSISIDSTKTINDLISAVNTSDAKVTMSFNNLTGKFKLETKDTGTASANAFNTTNLVDSSGGLLATLGLTSGTGTTTVGQNSQYTLDGVSLSTSSNTITQNGVTYTLAGIGTTNVSLSQNVDAAVTKIKEFVTKYNDLISKIQDKLDEKYDRNYQPLTDEQKDSMKSEDITKWETKAKTGLLHNDSMLKSVLDNMRSALSTPISGVSYTLENIGITTGSWYEGGKLNIDETKLRTALTNDIDGVTKLFSNESTIAYNPQDTSSSAALNRQQRDAQNGVITRLYDILNDNVRTTQGKGALLTKAGITGDSTEYSNLLYNEIKDLNTSIKDENDRLSNKETAYYNKFSRLESYMSQMNSQSSWLTTQLSKM